MIRDVYKRQICTLSNSRMGNTLPEGLRRTVTVVRIVSQNVSRRQEAENDVACALVVCTTNRYSGELRRTLFTA